MQLIFFGRLCDLSVFLEQGLQCHPQAEVGNTFVQKQKERVLWGVLFQENLTCCSDLRYDEVIGAILIKYK